MKSTYSITYNIKWTSTIAGPYTKINYYERVKS